MGKQTNNNYKVKKHGIDYIIVNKLVFLMYAILITLPLLFRGGYFEKELLPILIAVNIVFVIWLFIQRHNYEFKIFNNPVEILFFGIVIMYMLSIGYGVNKRGSIIELTKYFSYFAIIILGINLSKNKELEKGILDAIIIGSIIVSIIGIGTAIGTWEYPGAVLGTRISSTFQYPNTLAAYVGAIFFLSLTLLINEKNKAKKGLYGIVLGTLIFTFILTYSRAMWVMFPISVLLYFILMPNSLKLETLIYMIGSVIISVPASFLFTRGVSVPNNKVWIIFIIASLGTGILIYIVSLLDNKFRSVSIKKLLVLLMLIIVLIIALGVYVINSTTEVSLSNDSLENKWTTLNRNITNVQPSTDYILKLTYTGKKSSEAANIGRVLVYNISDNDETTQLSLENIIELVENTYEIPFTTGENSVGVRISFQNYYAGTSITVKESVIIEANDNKSLVEIPLKYKYIPESIVSRFNSITASDTSLTRRITFIKDGLEIIKDYLILGTGGEGWRTLYQSYQSEPYISNLAHNFFLQVWIEIGLIGLIMMISILILLTIASFSAFKQSEDDNIKALIVGLYITIFTMIFHSIIDFDMSLSGYAIVVWVIVGVLVSNLNFANIKLSRGVISKISESNTRKYIYGISMITLSIIYTIGSIIMGDIYTQKAIEANESNEIVSVMKNLEKATRFDKFEPSYKIDLSNVYMQMFSTLNDINYAKKAIEQVDDFIKVSPYSIQTNAKASSFYLSIGEIDKGLEYLEKSVELQPMSADSYIQKLDGYFAVFDYYYSKGEDRKAKEALKEGLTVKDQILEVNKKSEKPIVENIDLIYKIGEAQFFLGNMDKLGEISQRNLVLDFAYYFDVDANNDEKLDMLYISKPEGSKIQYERAQENDYVRIINNGEKSGFIYVNSIKLEPNTKYLIEMKARGTTKSETFKAYAWSNGSADPNQGSIDSITLTEEWETYSFEFTTDSDVQPGKQYIRLQHSGNDGGYIDIKDLEIFKVID